MAADASLVIFIALLMATENNFAYPTTTFATQGAANSSSDCNFGFFWCGADQTCIYNSWKCDGERDCSDGSDEVNCHSIGCKEGELRCSWSNGQCLPGNWVCDGEVECFDESDETNCNSTTAISATATTAIATTMKTTTTKGCPDDFFSVADGCYALLSDVSLSHSDARDECSRRHQSAHLPVISNRRENDVIIELIRQQSTIEMCPAGAWTSGKRSHAFLPFSWRPSAADDEPRLQVSRRDETINRWSSGGFRRRESINWTDWTQGRPRYAFGQRENCLYLDPANNWKWNQRNCDDRLCVVCQILP